MTASTDVSNEPPEADTGLQADFSEIRYGQCWEDADVLMEGLDVQHGDTCLSIASGGDNALALLTRRPACVVAIDLSAAQLACLALRVAAYRRLHHGALLELVGSRSSNRRMALYRRCRPELDEAVRAFWDARPALIERGLGAAGRFERYLRIFRRWVLPLAHSPERVERLLTPKSPAARRVFYRNEWDNGRWRLLFRFFFSRFVMGRLGRDPQFFEHVEGSVARHLRGRTRYALTELDPFENPYLQWILTGRHRTARPLALRTEHFETIRRHLDRLEWHQTSLAQYLREQPPSSIDRFNLSDVFEYVSEPRYHDLLRAAVRASRSGGRLAYWNMLVPRQRPASMAEQLHSLTDRAEQLHARDQAFFYERFVLEEIRANGK